MNKTVLNRSLAVAMSFGALGALSPTASATTLAGRVSAHLPPAITVVEDSRMSFAAVAPAPSGAVLVLSTTGSVSASAGAAVLGRPVPGVFTAHGQPNFPVVVSFSTGDAVTGPGAAMELGGYTTDAPPAFDAQGNLRFRVGATLVVNPHQAIGTYSGTYTVTVNY